VLPSGHKLGTPFETKEVVDGVECRPRHASQGVAVEVALVGIGDEESMTEGGKWVAGIQ
jgi:hypothetical protein